MAANSIEINRIYILPTRHGFSFFGVVLVMILVGSATGNNLIYSLAFVLFGVFVLTMIATHRNLKKLEVELVQCEDGFAGEGTKIKIAVHNRSEKARFLIQSRAKAHAARQMSLLNEVPPRGRQVVEIPLIIDRRGVYSVPALQIGTFYPLGLFWSWTVLRFDGSIYVYPRRMGDRYLEANWFGEGNGANRGQWAETQHEDFREHTRYLEGESQHHVDWKAFARRGELLTKRYEMKSPQHFVLEWSRVAPLGAEVGLSQLAQWVDELREGDNSFELILPGESIGQGRGWQHGQECLRALARFRAEAA